MLPLFLFLASADPIGFVFENSYYKADLTAREVSETASNGHCVDCSDATWPESHSVPFTRATI